MSDELNAPEPGDDSAPTEQPGPPQPRKHTMLNVIGLGLTLFGLVAARSFYRDGNRILAFFVIGMLGIVWLELAAINVRDRRYNQRINSARPGSQDSESQDRESHDS